MGRSRYAILKQILDYFEVFEQQESSINLESFVNWMVKNLEKQPEHDEYNTIENIAGFMNNVSAEFKFTDDKARFLESLSHVARYHEFYTRKALKDLIINTRIEYLFLLATDQMEKAKKTDLINVFNLEYTTGMDTIRRLSMNGLLDEIQDEKDKRAKLLVLTEKGKKILAQAKIQMERENRMFLATISDNKWKKVLPAIEELDSFHNSVYQNYNDKSFAELCNLMDSLKHYYK